MKRNSTAYEFKEIISALVFTADCVGERQSRFKCKDGGVRESSILATFALKGEGGINFSTVHSVYFLKYREKCNNGYILAWKVFRDISLVKAPMPLLEMAAREKWYSVFGRRPSTT